MLRHTGGHLLCPHHGLMVLLGGRGLAARRRLGDFLRFQAVRWRFGGPALRFLTDCRLFKCFCRFTDVLPEPMNSCTGRPTHLDRIRFTAQILLTRIGGLKPKVWGAADARACLQHAHTHAQTHAHARKNTQAHTDYTRTNTHAHARWHARTQTCACTRDKLGNVGYCQATGAGTPWGSVDYLQGDCIRCTVALSMLAGPRSTVKTKEQTVWRGEL